MDDALDALFRRVDDNVGIAWCLVRGVDSGEALDLAVAGSLEVALAVRLLAVLEGSGDVDEETRSCGLDGGLCRLSRVVVRSDRCGDYGGAGSRQLGRDEGDSGDVLVPVLGGEAQLLGQLGSDGLSEEHRDRSSTLLVQRDLKGTSDRVLARVVVTCEEDGESLLSARRVGLPEDLDDLRVREPLRNWGTGAESFPDLGTGEVEGRCTLWHLVLWHVLVSVRQVRHLCEGHDLDSDLGLVLGDKRLGVVGTVEVDAVLVLSRTGVITSDAEGTGTEILSDDGVPESLSWTSHPHGQGQEGKHGHTLGIRLHDGLVCLDSGEVVHVHLLRDTDNGMQKEISLGLSSCPDGKLLVSSVERVSGLERHDTVPGKLLELSSQLGGRVPQADVVVVLWLGDGLDGSTDVEVVTSVQVLDSRVKDVVSAENLLGLSDLVGLVDIVNGEDGDGGLVPPVSEGHSDTGLESSPVDRGLVDVETDWHGEDGAICHPEGLDDGLIVLLVHETLERGEPSVEDELEITQVPLSEVDVRDSL